MPAGEAFTPRQQEDIVRAIRAASRNSGGLTFSVYVGSLAGSGSEHPRAHAERLHAALGAREEAGGNPTAAEHDASRVAAAAADCVLVAVDPQARRLEIVTGADARRWLDDRSCALAAATMTSSFAAGDLAGGIVAGLQVLGDHARHPRTLHAETP